MLISTTGIVLYQADYSETSLIVKAFTEQFGLQSYIVKGVRKKGAKIKKNLFGPLSVLDIVSYGKENAGLRLIKEVSIHRQFNVIAGDIARSSVLLFMNELLYRSIKGEMPDKKLFAFISQSIEELDSGSQQTALYPILFSLRLAGFLGFEPQNNFSEAEGFFDMQEGEFCSQCPDHPYYIASPYSKYLSELLSTDPETPFPYFDHASRMFLLERVLEYFRLHLPAFGEMKSHHILSTVLQDLEG